jgi:hypothetical protein
MLPIAIVVGGLFVAGVILLKQWMMPPGGLAGSRPLTVVMLEWLHEHLPNAGVVLGIAGLILPFLLRRLERRSAAEEKRRARDKAVMLRRVRNRWITGVLEQSLADEGRVSPGLARRPDAVWQPDVIVRRLGQEAEYLPTGTSLRSVFPKLGGGLLVLGGPGAGKTTALLELARSLLDDAADDATLPMPVVFNLSSWVTQRFPLAEWLVDEMHASYDVPRSIARGWVAEGEVLPLLDGLDEVPRAHRAECVDAINTFQAQHGPMQLVVCSRTEEYTRLDTRLQMEEAVELQPLTRQQVYAYLESAGAALADVQKVLADDERVWTLLRSPLVLSIAALTYRGRPADALRTPGKTDERLEQLLTDYVERMFEHRPAGRWIKDQMVEWLARLAGAMRDRNQTEFHLDRLEPDWLPTKAQRRMVDLLTATAVGLAFGLLSLLVDQVLSRLPSAMVGTVSNGNRLVPALETAVASGLVTGMVLRMRRGLGRGLAVALVAALVTGLTRGLSKGLVQGLAYGLSSGLVYGLLGGGASHEPVEQVRWSWRRLSFGFVGGLILSLISRLISPLLSSPVGGWETVLLGGLVNGLLFGLIFGLVRGMTDERSTPNEGIRRSARHALAVGLPVGAVFGLVAVLIVELRGPKAGLVAGPELELAVGLVVGLVFGLLFGLLFGGLACLRHLALRVLVAYSGFAPLRYIRFLDEATQRLFLRQAGSGYIFAHRLLLEHFAELDATVSAGRDGAPGEEIEREQCEVGVASKQPGKALSAHG